MARLTNAELAHMRLRMKEIRETAMARIDKSHTVTTEEPSDKQKMCAILDDDVELKVNRRYSLSPKTSTEWLDKTLREAFDFTALESEEVLGDTKSHEAAQDVVRKDYSDALDVIVLKDREAANQAFENFKSKYGD